MSVWWMVGAFALVLTPIILVHEIGHFVAARLSGIRVEEFGLGFPPRAVKLFESKGTLFSLNWIPLGGFVRPAGEDDPNVPNGLAAASKRARLFTLSAGAGANFLFAILIFWIAFMIGPSKLAVTITEVLPNSPAMAAGLETGDVILSVNGREAAGNQAIVVEEITGSAGRPVELVVLRNGEEVRLSVTPRLPGEYDAATDGPTGIKLASKPTGENESQGPVQAAVLSVANVIDVVWNTLRAPVLLVRGQISPSDARPVSVVGISQLAGQYAQETATRQDWFPILWFSAVISVALGFTNLLPIPALDGGRILFVLVEAIRGRRIEPEREGMVHLVGMLVLLGLMVLIIIQDIVNPIIPF
ncbi:MAG: M50 family metallopeptidase [Chloroflexi bacterium]|nr:M50 family metallopeptidase [Chloroflexota bacterium]MCI0577064.1 M50 family metallopeptidase [Chloroflexota bacterium]MCI0643534.1 M50 family metallopeptidase [Chloroflexota bacterium]MCI0728144.1 M50 family metallopeptidase [Chloroflexota bacterium]